MKLLEVVLFVLFVSITTLVVLWYFSISSWKINYFNHQIENVAQKISILNRFDWYVENSLSTWQQWYIYISWDKILTGSSWKCFYDCKLKTWDYIWGSGLTYTGIFCKVSSEDGTSYFVYKILK